jgi:uncharacterized protein YjdB
VTSTTGKITALKAGQADVYCVINYKGKITVLKCDVSVD